MLILIIVNITDITLQRYCRINVKHGPVKLLDVEIGKRMLHLDRVRHLKKGELIYSKQHFKKVYGVLKKKLEQVEMAICDIILVIKYFFRSEDRILCEILLSYSWLHPGDSVFYILSLNFPTTTTTLISNKTSSKGIPTALVSYKISWQTSGKEWKSCVESAFITRKYTTFLLSLTNVMVQGVSLNNPTAAVCDLNPQLRGTTREGKLSGHRLSCSVQYFNTFDTTVKRIIKQQGHGACLNLTVLFPLLSLLGDGEICPKKLMLKT